MSPCVLCYTVTNWTFFSNTVCDALCGLGLNNMGSLERPLLFSTNFKNIINTKDNRAGNYFSSLYACLNE